MLQFFPSRRCDYRFLIDLRAVLEAPLPSPVVAQPPVVAGRTGVTEASAPVTNSQTPLLSSLHMQQAIDLKITACQVLSTTHYIDVQKSATLAALFKGECPRIIWLIYLLIIEFKEQVSIEKN